MILDAYQEHLDHSAPCASRWDGFDRGDGPAKWAEEDAARNADLEAEFGLDQIEEG